jgi:mannose-1-phosphate guanylyltransferase
LLEGVIGDVSPLFPPEHLYLITGQELRPHLCQRLPEFPDANVLAEPCHRNTAGAIAYALARFLAAGASENTALAVFPADHVIEDSEDFREAVERAMNWAEEEPVLVCIGIPPTRPDTGFGYIEKGDEAGEVLKFHEKPEAAEAQAMLDSGRFLWNSGMVFGRISTILAGIEKVAPDFHQALRRMTEALGREEEDEVRRIFEGLRSISLDYALLEHADNLRVVQGAFPWDNLNAWDALKRLLEQDEAGNAAVGDPLLVDCEGCLVYNAQGAERMTVATLGLKDIAIITTNDATLVIPLDRAQEVSRVLQEDPTPSPPRR